MSSQKGKAEQVAMLGYTGEHTLSFQVTVETTSVKLTVIMDGDASKQLVAFTLNQEQAEALGITFAAPEEPNTPPVTGDVTVTGTDVLSLSHTLGFNKTAGTYTIGSDNEQFSYTLKSGEAPTYKVENNVLNLSDTVVSFTPKTDGAILLGYTGEHTLSFQVTVETTSVKLTVIMDGDASKQLVAFTLNQEQAEALGITFGATEEPAPTPVSLTYQTTDAQDAVVDSTTAIFNPNGKLKVTGFIATGYYCDFEMEYTVDNGVLTVTPLTSTTVVATDESFISLMGAFGLNAELEITDVTATVSGNTLKIAGSLAGEEKVFGVYTLTPENLAQLGITTERADPANAENNA